MNYINRAIKSILRRPGKSLLLFMLVFILSTIIIGAIAVERAVNNTEANLRNQMRPLLTFDMDTNALMNEDGTFNTAERITADTTRRIMELPQVSQNHYMGFAHIQTHQLIDYIPGGERHPGNDNFPNQFTIQGGSNEIPLQFNEGILDLVAGHYFTTESGMSTSGVKPIIISEEIANLNHLAVGSIIPLELNVLRPQPSELRIGAWEEDWHLNPENIYATETFKLEVIGLFGFPVIDEHLSLEQQIQTNWESQILLNTIFMTTTAVEEIQNFQRVNMASVWEEALTEIGTTVEAFFGRDLLADPSETSFIGVLELYDAREIEAFKASAYDLLPDYWLISDLTNSFDAISSSMDSLLEIGQLVLLISIGATILILSLLITLSLHDRRNEIGIYSALGEKKAKTVTQLLIEIMVIAITGMSLAVFTGSFVSEHMSRTMIQNQLMADSISSNSFHTNPSQLSRFGFNQEMSVDDMLETFEMSLSLETIILFFGAGIAVVTLSTIVPVIYVINLEPKKILMEN